MSFGARVRELRKQRSLTQRQLADRIGRDFSYISKIENDRLEYTPSVQTILKLGEALEADELELMKLANKVPPILENIAEDKEARRFFRRASELVKTPERWRSLHSFLEEQEWDNQK